MRTPERTLGLILTAGGAVARSPGLVNRIGARPLMITDPLGERSLAARTRDIASRVLAFYHRPW